MEKNYEDTKKPKFFGVPKTDEVFKQDEQKDKVIIKEFYEKSKDYAELAKKLTQYFTKKYGSEFGGNVVFGYDPAGNVISMTCFDQDRVFEVEVELPDIATNLRLLRKATASKKV